MYIYIYIHEQRSRFLFTFFQLSSTKLHPWRHLTKDDDARDRAYSPAIGSAFASHPFLIRRITKRARVTGAREQVANASSFIARAKRIVSKRAGRARRLDALRLVGPPWKSISNSPRNPVLSRKVNYIRRGELVEELAGGEKMEGIPWIRETFLRNIPWNDLRNTRNLDIFPSVFFFFFFLCLRLGSFEVKFFLAPLPSIYDRSDLCIYSIDSRNGERSFFPIIIFYWNWFRERWMILKGTLCHNLNVHCPFRNME